MKQISPDNCRVFIAPAFLLLLVLAVFVVPLDWLTAWGLAVFLHETGHLLGLAIFRIPVCAVTIQCSGVYIRTPPMLPAQEAVVAAMGPIVGLLGVVFLRLFPHLAVCAVALFAFNVLPVGGFDGGRVLRSLLGMLLPEKLARFCLKTIQMIFMLALLILGICLRWSFPVVVGIIMPALRIIATFPCKRRKQIVQWSK